MTPEEYKKAIITIGKEHLATLPAAEFPGKIVLVDNSQKLNEIIKELRNVPLLGFDTETRPSFKRGLSYDVALIQLSTQDTCYLIRTKEVGFPKELIGLIENPDIIKVGLSLHDDFHNIKKVVNIDPKGFIDLQPYVKEFKIADNSLSRIYGILFEERISKGQRLTNWEAPELTESQQHYAALDAYACLKIYNYLREGKFRPQESKYLVIPPDPIETNPENIDCES